MDMTDTSACDRALARSIVNRSAFLNLWEEIAKRFHTVELVDEVTRLPNNFIRAIKDVPVRLHPI